MAKEESKAPKTEAKSNTFKAKVKMPGYSKRAIVTAKIGNKEIALMEIIEQEKEKVYNKLVYQIPLIIKHCFPELSFVAIEEMSMREQGEYYARALWMLENFENITLQAKKD